MTSGVNESGITYAKSRLYLGISYVGSLVLLSIYLLSSGELEKLFSVQASSALNLILASLRFLCIFLVFSLPFELAGYLIDLNYQRTERTPLSQTMHWVRGVLIYATLFTILSGVAAISLSYGGVPTLLAASALSSWLLLRMQKCIAGLIGGLNFKDLLIDPTESEESYKITTTQTASLSFTGGITGISGNETIVIPDRWINELSRDQLKTAIQRRINAIRTGSRNRGILIALGYNLVSIAASCVLTSYVSQLNLVSPAGFIAFCLYQNLLSFIALLILPRLSQLGVFEVDRFTLNELGSMEKMGSALRAMDRYLENEPQRNKARELIFHPIPSLASRFAQLEKRNTELGAWNCTRYFLFLSWSGLSLLPRAVHCNAGNPDLWAILPSD